MEQASQADVHGHKRLVRKHALHSVMAARRFEQSGQVGLGPMTPNTKSPP